MTKILLKKSLNTIALTIYLWQVHIVNIYFIYAVKYTAIDTKTIFQFCLNILYRISIHGISQGVKSKEDCKKVDIRRHDGSHESLHAAFMVLVQNMCMVALLSHCYMADFDLSNKIKQSIPPLSEQLKFHSKQIEVNQYTKHINTRALTFLVDSCTSVQISGGVKLVYWPNFPSCENNAVISTPSEHNVTHNTNFIKSVFFYVINVFFIKSIISVIRHVGFITSILQETFQRALNQRAIIMQGVVLY